MRSPSPLRPELASVCRFVGIRATRRTVRAVPPGPAAAAGVLRELAERRGLA